MGAERWRRLWLLAAGLLGAAAVVLGATAAHGLTGPSQDLAEKASRYGAFHALALLSLAQAPRPSGRWMVAAGLLFIFGALVFCGALTAMALLDLPAAPLAPVGGTAFILGWLALALSAIAD